jgi:integrase
MQMTGIVFSLKGRPFQIETTGKHFRICVDKSKVDRKGRTQYSLRHTFNTLALMSLPEESVRDMMGHTGYRREYDHRTGRDLLEKHKDIRGVMFNRMWG